MLYYPLGFLGWCSLLALVVAAILIVLRRHEAAYLQLALGLMFCALDVLWHLHFVHGTCTLFAHVDAQIAHYARQATVFTTVPFSILFVIAIGFVAFCLGVLRRSVVVSGETLLTVFLALTKVVLIAVVLGIFPFLAAG